MTVPSSLPLHPNMLDYETRSVDPHAYAGLMTITPGQLNFFSSFLQSLVERRYITIEELYQGHSAGGMYIYSSLSPTRLVERGAELRDAILGRHPRICPGFQGPVQDVIEGPIIPPSQAYGFRTPQFQLSDLAHHAFMHLIQLSMRYPALDNNENATFRLSAPNTPELTKPELRLKLSRLIPELSRALGERGLLPGAREGYVGSVETPASLRIQCEDALHVFRAMETSKDGYNCRFMPYDTSISQERNEWRQAGFWSADGEAVVWHALTTYHLSLKTVVPELFMQ